MAARVLSRLLFTSAAYTKSVTTGTTRSDRRHTGSVLQCSERDAFGGVPGGIPSGIPGGQLGGVIGGVIGGVVSTGAKPVPPATGKSGAPVRVGERVRPPKAIV